MSTTVIAVKSLETLRLATPQKKFVFFKQWNFNIEYLILTQIVVKQKLNEK